MTHDPLIGTLLAERYRMERLIGSGAMGRVYQAEHVHMRKRVAVKVLHRELMSVPEIVQRFEREAQAASQMEHPHVALATDFGKLPDGSVYLVLEYVEGVPLTERIKQGPIKLASALNIAQQVSSALEVAHQRGIVHRDLKPDNLLLVSGHDEDFVKVLDFGIAKVPTEASGTDRPLTQVGMVYGTPEYMAPEQALGQEVDGRADIYALGVILFEMLTGRRPYLGPAVGLLGQQLSKPLPRMGSVADVKVPPSVEQLVVEMLASDPSKRLPDVHTLSEQLLALSEALLQGKLEGRGTLLSVSLEEVTTRIEQVTRNIPQPVKTVVKSRVSRAALLSLGFGAVGVVCAIFAVGAFAEKKAQTAREQVVSPPPAPLEIPDDSVEVSRRLEGARKEGLPAILALSKELPSEGVIQAELSLEFARANRFEESLDAARLALALDPKLNENPKIAGALFRAAQATVSRSAAFRMLKGPMGSAGASIMWDLAHTSGVSKRVQAYANQLLATDEVRALATPALLVALDLERKRSCPDVLGLVQEAAKVGDARALSSLKDLAQTTGCGVKKKDDCYPCLHDSGVLSDAISTLEKREAVTPVTTP